MIKKFNVTITPFGLERMIHLYLPDDYYESEECYPVIYMYDGHNLFFDEDATYGKSWGLKEFLDQYDKKFIVVGLECNHEGTERLNEFCPYNTRSPIFGPIEGKGKELMDWVVEELKPMIDREYRTYPSRECTAIAGSSMGGLMALYSVMKYNEFFSKAACISSAIDFCMEPLKADTKNVQINPDTRVYFSFGTAETDSVIQSLQNIEYFAEKFLTIGAACKINVVRGGSHCEACWEKENPIYFDFLWRAK
ncbi:MAG: alpha/beta hydrolase [Lachnospiraceae bacterium]